MTHSSRVSSFDSISSTTSTSTEDFPFSSVPYNHNKLSITRKLCESKFTIYLAKDDKTKKSYAIKAFPWDQKYNIPCLSYVKESRMTQFTHPNIITAFECQKELQIEDPSNQKISYIIMEYAKNGDLYDVIISDKINLGDIISRTYFRQLVAGLEAIHEKGSAHLDIKLDNLLLDENFQLKIADFDLCWNPEDPKVISKGSVNYRAPELAAGRCENPQKADMYSLGIILFVLKTGGKLPYDEKGFLNAIDMRSLLKSNQNSFWQKQCEILNKKACFFPLDFRKLFTSLTEENVEKRPSLKEIKESVWYSKCTYSEKELTLHMRDKINETLEIHA